VPIGNVYRKYRSKAWHALSFAFISNFLPYLEIFIFNFSNANKLFFQGRSIGEY
jgi:hypothetical protein